MGVRPGVRVGLCHERGAELVLGALATLSAGGAYVALDPAYPHARLEQMLRDSDTFVLLTQTSTSPRIGAACARVIDLDAVFESCDERDHPPEPLAGADDVAYIIFTSGSTGQPKGVAVSHDSLDNLVEWHCSAFALTDADRSSMVASPAFDASIWETWPPLAVGASLHVPDLVTAASPDELRDWLCAEAITTAFVPTPMAEALLAREWPPEVALRLLLTGGDVLHRRPSSTMPFTLVNNYGVTEATVVTTSSVVAPDDGSHTVPSIGRPIAGTCVYVLDPHGAPVRAGETGELYIGGRGVAIGYVNRPQETDERFVADPWRPGSRMYRTGDLVRATSNGDLQFVGRFDSQVQILGNRVELDEIAGALNAHPTVERCAVNAGVAKTGARRVTAYVVAANGSCVCEDELRAFLEKQLPSYMLPTAFVELDAIPLTRNGKVDCEALPAPGHALVDERGVAATPVESALADVFSELLDIRGFGRHDNFFELGGHSLLGAQLVARIHEHFGVEVTLLEVFDNPTLAQMAEIVDDAMIQLVASLSDEEVEQRLSTSSSHE